MSNSVDNRVLKMDFDNKRFEQNVSQTIKTLSALDKGLALENAAKGFGDLDKATRKVSLSSISDGLDNLTSKFSTMSIIGITAIQNLTNSVVNEAKKIVKALTIDPIKSGLDEYETKMNAITTILTNTKSKGTTLDDVNASLADLNTYADQTIYNFAEMTRNIGTFTAAGITLEASTSAIKGIANLAAGSGSSAAQASTAMYQLSQAMAAGSVKLQDWNSVVNAGMGGELFQNALKATAKSMGAVVDESVPFRESLREGWITSDVLTKTLAGFSMNQDLVDAATQVKTITQLMSVMEESVQSGWSVSWENIIGNKDEAVDLLTAVSNGFNNLVGPGADARNTMLSYWKALGGRDAIINALGNSFTSLMNIINPIKEAFRTIFPAVTGQQLLVFSRNLEALTERFKIGEDTAKKFKNIFTGLFSILGIGKQVVVGIYNAFKELFSSFGAFDLGILDFFEKIGFFFTGLNKYAKSTDLFTFSLLGVKSALTKFFYVVIDKATMVYEKLKTVFGSFSTLFNFGKLDTSGLETFSSTVMSKLEPLTTVGDKISAVFGKIVGFLESTFAFIGMIGAGIGKVLTTIKEQFSSAFGGNEGDGLKNLFQAGLFAGLVLIFAKITKFTSSFSDILEGVTSSLEAFQTSLKAKSLLAIAGAIAILTVSLVVLSMLDAEKLGAGLAIMSVLFLELFGASGALTSITKNGSLKSASTVAITLVAVAIAMSMLAKAAASLALTDSEKIGEATRSIGLLMVGISAATFILSKSDGDIVKAAIGVIAFAFGISQLVKAVTKMSEMDPEKMKQGLIGVGAVLLGLMIFLRAGKIEKLGISGGLGMTALAKGIMILGGAVLLFGEMDLPVLQQGLLSVGALLLALGVFARLAGNNSSMLTTAIGIAILGKSLQLFIPIIEGFADVPYEIMKNGLIALGVALVVLGVAIRIMPKDLLLKAAGLVVLAFALQMLTGTIKTLGELDPENLKQGLLTLAALFGGLIIAGYLLGPVIPILLGVTAILAALALSMVLAGAGATMFAAGLLALSTIGVIGLAAITAVITGIILLIPVVAKGFADGMIAFASALLDGIPSLITAFNAIMLSIVYAIRDNVPLVVGALLTMIVSLLTTIDEKQGEIMDAAANLIVNFLLGFASKLSDITMAAISVMLAFVDGITQKLPEVIDAGVKLIISFINGIAFALTANGPELIDAFINLFWAIVEVVVDIFNVFGVDLNEVGSNIMEKLVYVFTEFIPNIVKAFTDMVSNAIETVSNFTSDFKAAGTNIIEGLLGGIMDGAKDIANGVKEIGTGALTALKDVLGIHSPSKAMAWVGKMVGLGMEEGINDSKSGVNSSAVDMGDDLENEMRSMKLGDTGEEVGNDLGNGVAKGITNSKSGATKAAADLGKSIYDETVAWINERKYYNQLTLDEELKAWQNLQTKYAEGSEENKKIAKEEYRVTNAIKSAEFQHSMDWIDERKYYNQLSLSQELAAWERVQARYDHGTDERKKADREIYRLKNELVAKQEKIDLDYYNNTKSINDNLIADIKSLNKAYADAVKSRTDSIYNAFSLFASVEPLKDISGEELTDNLTDQVDALVDWKQTLKELSTKGLSKDLIAEFEQMGPSSLSELKALNTLTEPELDKYSALWITKHEFARTQAISELTKLKSETTVKIRELNDIAKTELSVVNATWTASLNELNVVSTEALIELSDGWEEKLGTLRTDTKAKFVAIQEDIITLGWETIGNNIMYGIAQGVNNKSDFLAGSVRAQALRALRAAKDALGIQSPSKEFAKLGEFMSVGMANGITRSTNLVVDSTSEMGKSATAILRDALSSIGSLLSEDLDMSPVIKPVIDLSNIENARGMMAELFDVNGVTLTTASKTALAMRKSTSKEVVEPQNGSAPKETQVSLVQNNYSPKALSRFEIYRQTRNQISTMKGVVDNL